ncbi:hypothetical protein GPALN_003408 [Globodera pallida]|uniref:Protein RFT1 homolog n=1 Tax=Globodera pallida TaxID=36090 RepID=A0A183BNV4_GLOPA|nr:hypothetical protein GPALN_003408 [Globodera pallida]
MPGILSLLSSFLEANGLGGPDFWGRSILVMQGFNLLINTYLELRFLVPMLTAVFSSPSSLQIPSRLPAMCLSLYFVLLQCVVFVLLLFRLVFNSMILPLVGVHLVLVASILLQLVQMLFTGQTGTELFIWCWYLSACITFTLYQAMLFSTERSPKLCATIAPTRTRVRRLWLPPHPPHGLVLAEARELRFLVEAVA